MSDLPVFIRIDPFYSLATDPGRKPEPPNRHRLLNLYRYQLRQSAGFGAMCILTYWDSIQFMPVQRRFMLAQFGPKSYLGVV
jgi:hypothetical protein